MQHTRRYVLFGLAAFPASVSAAAQTGTPTFKNDVVPDEETAIRIALAIWEPVYGKQEIAAQKPYHAILQDGVWLVNGSLPANWAGGTAHVAISARDGRIIQVFHGK